MLSVLTRRQKRYILIFFDSVVVVFSLYVAFCLRLGSLAPLQEVAQSLPLFGIMLLAGPFVSHAFRLPSMKLATFDLTSLARIFRATVTLGTLAVLVIFTLAVDAPRSIPFIFAALFFCFAIIGRNFACAVLDFSWKPDAGAPVAIYGAGAAGVQLASALRQSDEVRPVVFIDDNPAQHGLLIGGLQVRPPTDLPDLVALGRVSRVLVTMPSVPRSRLDELVKQTSGLGCDVQVMPSYVDLIYNKNEILNSVTPDALLGRDKVDLDAPEIARAYAGRVVMVTGAGGSIGSELCRQLLKCRPARIVLFEQSEVALYEIDQELRKLVIDQGIGVTTRLGSVGDASRVETVMRDENVEIILHAAAYKHVPLVEDNQLEGARNNVLGTQVVAEAARAAGVERFILVSTDKAVRPTNIMGATKRMAELVIQDLQTRSDTTRFAMVRFGNVLGSSGSFLPLFQRQIRAGGPVTVTHPEVTRFFMTIPEAARLVLLAGAYATGGDVFVLDMGKPMKIIDIARRMIAMSGSKVREPGDDSGIEIEITGLRPGEKLYEELLIDDNSLVGTPHPKILRAEETRLSQIEVAGMLKDLRIALADGDDELLRRNVRSYVHGYHLQQVSGDG